MRLARSLVAASLVLATACVAPEGADMPRSTVLEARVYILADYDVVWDHFTRADLYAEWYSAPCLEFGSEAGDDLRWGTARDVVYRGTLRSLEKGEGLSHTFQFVGFGFEEPSTPVEIEIRQQGPTVFVHVRQDCNGAPRTQDMIGPVGWAKVLSRLKTLLETGTAMPWPEPTEL